MSSRSATPADAGRGWDHEPGEWYAVLGASVVLALPASERHRVPALWAAVDDGAGFEALLDTLLADGLGGLPGFVLLGLEGSGPGPAPVAVRVLVRGEATVDLCGSDEGPGCGAVTNGRGAHTWVEQRVEQVTTVRVDLGGSGAPAGGGGGSARGTTLGTALVRAGGLHWPSGVATGAVPPDTVPGPLVTVPDEDLPEPETVQERVDADHDGMTRPGAHDPGHLAGPSTGIPGQPQAPGVTARPVARLVFSSGDVVDVDRAVLVGRAPEARRFSATDQPRLVRVSSPQQEISSTHLEVRPGSGADHGSAVVTDLGSTNGTLVVQPGLDPEDLQPGVAVQLHPGAVVDLGDGITIQVTRA